MGVSEGEDIFTTLTTNLDECDLSVVCLCGELDASSAPVFISDVGQVLTRKRNIIMDVHLLDYVDSTGVASILSTKNALEAMGRKLFLVGCHGLLSRILHITHIENELRCFDKIEDAVASMH